ncbi:hypothetical protein HDV01_006233 [Terramyces sp. JEL0728]|nr:hypothetical protein HDV01_006233 [Terramyces sp. JEL0728]
MKKIGHNRVRSSSYASETESSATRHLEYTEGDFQIGKFAKIKGAHLKNTSFSRLCLVQDLCFDTGDAISEASSKQSGIPKSISIQSFQPSEETHHSTTWILSFSSEGSYLASGGHDGTIVVWDLNPNVDPDYHSSPMDSMDKIPEEPAINLKKSAASFDGLNSRRRTNSISGKPTSLHSFDSARKGLTRKIFNSEPYRVFNGHQLAITDLSWTTGDFLLSASLDGSVQLWHISQTVPLCMFKHRDCVSSVRFHPLDSNLFASGSLDGRIRVWSIDTKSLLYWNEISGDAITALEFTRDGSTIVCGTLSGSCVFYEFNNLRYDTQIHITAGKGIRSKDAKITGIERMPHSPDHEERFLITSADSRVRLINARDKSLFKAYKGLDLKYTRAFANFSSDGEYIIAPSEDKQVFIWDTFPFDENHQYSGVLSSVIHRHIDTARAPGQERFVASANNLTCALFAPWTTFEIASRMSSSTASIPSIYVRPAGSVAGAVIIVADDRGHVYVFENQA